MTCASVVIDTIYAWSIVYTRVGIAVIFVWKKAKNPNAIKTAFTSLAEKHIRPNNISKRLPLTDEKKAHEKKKLTDAAVPPFKTSRACASVVIYTIYACSIVYTRVRITVISVWKNARKTDLHYNTINTIFTTAADVNVFHFNFKAIPLANELKLCLLKLWRTYWWCSSFLQSQVSKRKCSCSLRQHMLHCFHTGWDSSH